MPTQSNSEVSSADERERILLSRTADRDRSAFAELYGNYRPRLFKFVYRLIRNYDAADELVNDVMLAVWRGAGEFRGAAKVSTWILGIAYRQTMRRLSRKRLSVVTDFDLDSMKATGNPDLEREEWVRTAIESLPEAQRAAVTLVFYLGLSYEEAASVADCPVNTIKTRMYHARQKLQKKLDLAGRPALRATRKHHA